MMNVIRIMLFIIYLVIVIGIPLVCCVVCGVFTKKIMESKGYSPDWFWFGFLLSVVGVIISVFVKNKLQPTQDTLYE